MAPIEPTLTKEFFYKRFPLWLALLLIFVFSFTYFLAGITQIVDVADEGIPTFGAQRILDGDLPYRNFWSIYAPGQFYVLAGLFKLFGSSVLVERLYDTAVRALVSVFVFAIIVRLASPGWGMAFWLIVTIWLKYFGYYGYPNFPAMFFSLASLYVLMGFFHKDRPKTRLVLSGMFAGLAGLFRQDSGFYLFVSEQIVVLAFAFFHVVPEGHVEGLPKRLVKLIPFASASLCGVMLPVLPVAIYFLSAVPAGELYYDLVFFPVKIFPVVRAIPFPGLLSDFSALTRGEVPLYLYSALLSERWSFYFSLSVLGAVLLFLAFDKRRPFRRGKKGGPTPIWTWEVGLFLVFGLFSLNTVRVRSDLPHLLPSFVSAGLLSAAMGTKLLTFRLFRKGWILGTGLAVTGLLLIYPIYEWQKPGIDEQFRQFLYTHNLRRAGPVGVNPYQADAIHYIQGVTYPWEPIFVGNNRHDLIYNNDIMFYFLSERHSATKYHELFPGLATSRIIQSKIIEDLQRNNVRFVVRLSRFGNPGVTNELVPVRLLDDFIAQNYQPVEKFGDWSVWKAK